MRKSKNVRGKWLLLAFALFFVALIGRLAWINFAPTEHSGRALRVEAANTWQRYQTINPVRGDIYDRNGKTLALSAQAETIQVIPGMIAALESYDMDSNDNYLKPFESIESLAGKLSVILEMDWKAVFDCLTSSQAQLYLCRQIPIEKADAVRALHMQGITFLYEPKRYYPLDNFASTIMGFVGTDNHGLSGLEFWYDDVLHGTAGSAIAIQSSDGSAIPLYDNQLVAAVDGADVILTIDEQLQTILERELSAAVTENEAASGGGIIMDPYTGEILAMASLPNFDLNHFAEADPALWNNPLVSDAFEPGSTFKIITCMAALTTGVASETSYFEDPGYYIVAGEKIQNWDMGSNHGTFSLLDAMRNSSNVIMGQVGLRLGAEKLISFQKLMGFGTLTGIDFPGETSGVLFDANSIRDVELFTAAFGQGPSVTPLQQLNAINAIVNGGQLLQPYLVKTLVDADGIRTDTSTKVIREVASASIMQRMRDILVYVLNAPGSKGASDSYLLAGKTGTANKLNDETGGYFEDKYMASTIGFAPAEKAVYSIYVYLDDPKGPNGYYGGQTVAPMFRKIAEAALEYAGYLPGDVTEAEITVAPEVKVPELIGKSKAELAALLLNSKAVISYIGSGDLVSAQYPAAGSTISTGQAFHLYMVPALAADATKTLIPNFSGQNLREISAVCDQLGLILVTKGSGLCIEQSVAAGTTVSKGSSIQITLA